MNFADQIKLFHSSGSTYATSGFHTTHASQVGLTLQDSLQAVCGFGGMRLVIDDLDDLDLGEVGSELVLIALEALFQVGLSNFCDEGYFA